MLVVDHARAAVRRAVGAAHLLAVASLVPMGTQGHSGDDALHHEAMIALILHIIGAAVVMGCSGTTLLGRLPAIVRAGSGSLGVPYPAAVSRLAQAA